MKIKLIDLDRQYKQIKPEIINGIEKVLDQTSFIMGENVQKFEQEFADYIEVKHSIAVANGTDALVIALIALGIKAGDEVITTPFTFFATAESIASIGAIPVFVDVKLDDYNIDEEKIEEKITTKTKAILPVHIFGQPCNMEKINEIAQKYNLFVIEDACQAVGAEFEGKKIGGLSDIACFSFFPTKNLGCAGDGGIITTNNDDLAMICRALRVHGSGQEGNKAYNILNQKSEIELNTTNSDNTVYNPLKYYNYLIGFNSRLDEIQAVILRIKLPLLENNTEERIEISDFFNENLKNTSLITPKATDNTKHVYHLYILQSEKREKVVNYLNEKGIATGIYYQVPLHLQKALMYLGYKTGDMPNAEYLSNRTFAIPLFPGMKEEEMEYIVRTIEEGDKIDE